MSESTKQSVYVRFDREMHERLNKLSQQSGDSVTKLVRMLVERALEQDTGMETLARMQAIIGRLDALEQHLRHAFPDLHERLGTLEQLVCTADANAARRSGLDHAKRRNLWCSTRYGVWELQKVIYHVLEHALLTDGHSRDVSRKLHADCQDASTVEFRQFLATIDAECAEIDTAAPAAMHPPPAVPRAPAIGHSAQGNDITSWLPGADLSNPAGIAKPRLAPPRPTSSKPFELALSAATGEPDEPSESDQPSLFTLSTETPTPPAPDANAAVYGRRSQRPDGNGHPGDKVAS